MKSLLLVLEFFIVGNFILTDTWDFCQFIGWLKIVRTIEKVYSEKCLKKGSLLNINTFKKDKWH
jgi:hypothetical protein